METYKIITKADNIYFVGIQGSKAIVLGRFYIDGKRATEGQYVININDGSQVLITVGADGQVLDKQVIPNV